MLDTLCSRGKNFTLRKLISRWIATSNNPSTWLRNAKPLLRALRLRTWNLAFLRISCQSFSQHIWQTLRLHGKHFHPSKCSNGIMTLCCCSYYLFIFSTNCIYFQRFISKAMQIKNEYFLLWLNKIVSVKKFTLKRKNEFMIP